MWEFCRSRVSKKNSIILKIALLNVSININNINSQFKEGRIED